MEATQTPAPVQYDILVRVDARLEDSLKELARANRRSVRQEVSHHLEKAIEAAKKRGIIPSTTERVGQ